MAATQLLSFLANRCCGDASAAADAASSSPAAATTIQHHLDLVTSRQEVPMPIMQVCVVVVVVVVEDYCFIAKRVTAIIILLYQYKSPLVPKSFKPHFSYKTDMKANYERHSRIHSGEKPNHCDMCSYSTANECDLVNHKRKHTGTVSPNINSSQSKRTLFYKRIILY